MLLCTTLIFSLSDSSLLFESSDLQKSICSSFRHAFTKCLISSEREEVFILTESSSQRQGIWWQKNGVIAPIPPSPALWSESGKRQEIGQALESEALPTHPTTSPTNMTLLLKVRQTSKQVEAECFYYRSQYGNFPFNQDRLCCLKPSL